MAAGARRRVRRGARRRHLPLLAAAVLAAPVLAPLSPWQPPTHPTPPQPVLRTVLPRDQPVTSRPIVAAPPEGTDAQAWHALMEFRRVQAAAGSPLGAPTSDISCPASLGACYQRFRGKVVLWHGPTGARALRPEVFELWSRRGVEKLGYPVSSEYPAGEDRRTDFQRGALVWVPRLQRVMEFNPGVEQAAVVVGDSQAGDRTWMGRGLSRLGYTPIVRGAGGTGYLNSYAGIDRYETALDSGQWLLPAGNPPVVVLEGGGNDTAYPDAAIAQAARTMARDLRQIYPSSKLVMVGVIGDGKGRRAAVDRLLSRVAAEEGVPFISPQDWWKRHKLKLEDGRHLSDSGHAAAAPVFARELSAVLGG